MYKVEDIRMKIENPIQNIRSSNLYVTLEALMHKEEDTLPKGVWDFEETKKDWAKIQKLCLEILAKNKKDIQVIAWFIEASIYNIQDDLKYWKDLEYILDEFLQDKDKDFAHKAFINLNKALKISWPNIMILYKKDSLKYSLSDFIKNKPLDQFEKLRELEYKNILFAIKEMKNILMKINKKIKEDVMMSSINLLNDYENAILSLNQLLPQKIIENNESNNISYITSRESAYKVIKEVMVYLKTHDPHSATPYLLKKACEWESKTFVEILNEFNDPVIIEKIFKKMD